MNTLLRAIKWLAKALVFFALFAFALNNPNLVTVHWFFGQKWTAPLVLVLLAAFTAGVVVGVLGMLPGWWGRRREGSSAHAQVAAAPYALPVAKSPPAPTRSARSPAPVFDPATTPPPVPDAVATPPRRDNADSRYPGAEHGV